MTAALGRAPGLAVVIVGDRKDSQTYVRNKVKACEECGIISTKLELKEEITQAELLENVRRLNADSTVDGVLVQLPLPSHINEATVLDEIALDKDVDGFHPSNLGLLAKRNRSPHAVPCTPAGVMEMLSRSQVTVQGANAVVIGRSDIVGVPVALLLLHANASVQILHSKTPKRELERAVGNADIVVACVGSAALVQVLVFSSYPSFPPRRHLPSRTRSVPTGGPCPDLTGNWHAYGPCGREIGSKRAPVSSM